MAVLEVKDQLTDPARRARELCEELAYHEHREHVLEYPLVSPQKLAALRKELADLEARGVPRSLGSASHRGPADPRPAFERANHQPAWPQSVTAVSPAELRELVGTGASDRPVFVGVAGLAGVHVALTYHDGALERAILRGDGDEGEDVTDNVRTIGSVPLMLRPAGSITESRVTQMTRGSTGPSTLTPVPPVPRELVVRGVVSMKALDLNALDRRRIDAGEPPYVKPAAALIGSVRRLDPRITASRPVRFFAADVAEDPPGIESHWQLLGALKSWGFAVTSLAWRCVGIEEALDFVSALQQEQPAYPYPLDGGELVMNRGTARNARQRISLPFAPAARKARVSSIYRAVGRSGTIFPVALLTKANDRDPVPDGVPVPAIDGTRLLDVQPDDLVQVVPGAVAPLLLNDRREASRPDEARDRCPSCRQYLRRPTDEPFLYCENSACKGRVRARLLHAIGPRGLGLKSVSAKNVDVLVSAGISSLADLFEVRANAIPQLGPALVSELASLRKLPLWRILYLLTIPHVGERAARIIASQVRSIEALIDSPKLRALEDLSPECVDAIVAWYGSVGRELVERIHDQGIVAIGEDICFAAPFSSRRIVLAGQLATPQDRFVDQLERRGANVEPHVTRQTSLLVKGNGAETEIAAASALDIPIVDEHAVVGMLKLEDERISRA